ncbi:MAG: hypothetical protein IJB25_13285 [Clostridia bacterium]|nr:hypothetical protein [Clostridia bacterium]
MKNVSRTRRKSALFEKDPDVLPFFSIHPKTKAGSVIRIAMSVFCMLALVLALLMRKGIMFLWFQKYSFLLYLVPMAGLVLLICLALFKRMKTMFMKIGLPGVILFMAFAVFMTFGGMMSYTANLSLIPKTGLENDGKKVVIMRACAEPDGTEYVVNENGVEMPQYPVSVDAYVYTVRVPEAVEGMSYTIEGEIKVPSASHVQFEVKEEWLDDNTLRVYLAKDTSGVGSGEIKVLFTEGETTPASAEPTESQIYRNSFEKNGKKVNLYRENGAIHSMVDTIMNMEESDFKQYLFAYPRTMFLFAKLNTKTEGAIVIEPNGELNAIHWEWIEQDNIARLSPSEDSVDVSGSITIYFNETVDPKDLNDIETSTQEEAED